jgi:hypothetical protein
MNQPQKKSKRLGLSERERILRDRKESKGLAPKRLTPLEMDLTEKVKAADDKVLKLEQDLEASRAAETSLQEELSVVRDGVKHKERQVQSEKDKLARERASIEAERRDNVKFRGDAIRFKKEIEKTFKPGMAAQRAHITKEQEKRRDEVNKHLETKAELEETKAKLKEATEKYRGLKAAADPRNIDVANMSKDDVEELRKKLTKHMKTLNGNGGK